MSRKAVFLETSFSEVDEHFCREIPAVAFIQIVLCAHLSKSTDGQFVL